MTGPSVFCPEHPEGGHRTCVACATARRRPDVWVSRRRYEEAVAGQEKDATATIASFAQDAVRAVSDVARIASTIQELRLPDEHLVELHVQLLDRLCQVGDGISELTIALGGGVGLGCTCRAPGHESGVETGADVHGSPSVDVPAAATAGDVESIVGDASDVASPPTSDALPVTDLNEVVALLDRLVRILASATATFPDGGAAS